MRLCKHGKSALLLSSDTSLTVTRHAVIGQLSGPYSTNLKLFCCQNVKNQFVINHQVFLTFLASKSLINRAGNNFSSLTGHVSFQIFILVGHFINLTGH